MYLRKRLRKLLAVDQIEKKKLAFSFFAILRCCKISKKKVFTQTDSALEIEQFYNMVAKIVIDAAKI